MSIEPVNASNSAVNATQALRPKTETDSVTRTSSNEQNEQAAAEAVASQSPPKPTVNTNGQTIGTILNVTA